MWNLSKKAAIGFLRVYVDKDGGIDIDDCGRVSEFLSARLDEKDPIPQAYFFGSVLAGAERPLKKPQDFVKAVGQNVFLTTYEPVDGAKEFEGTLLSYNEEEMTMVTLKKKRSTLFRPPRWPAPGWRSYFNGDFKKGGAVFP